MRFAVNVLKEFDPTAGSIISNRRPVRPSKPLAKPTRLQVFLRFAQYPLWSVMAVDNPEGAHDVEVTDWRFPFGAQALVDSSNRVISSSFHFGGSSTTAGAVTARTTLGLRFERLVYRGACAAVRNHRSSRPRLPVSVCGPLEIGSAGFIFWL
jgi:hypothetical protein